MNIISVNFTFVALVPTKKKKKATQTKQKQNKMSPDEKGVVGWIVFPENNIFKS